MQWLWHTCMEIVLSRFKLVWWLFCNVLLCKFWFTIDCYTVIIYLIIIVNKIMDIYKVQVSEMFTLMAQEYYCHLFNCLSSLGEYTACAAKYVAHQATSITWPSLPSQVPIYSWVTRSNYKEVFCSWTQVSWLGFEPTPCWLRTWVQCTRLLSHETPVYRWSKFLPVIYILKRDRERNFGGKIVGVNL